VSCSLADPVAFAARNRIIPSYSLTVLRTWRIGRPPRIFTTRLTTPNSSRHGRISRMCCRVCRRQPARTWETRCRIVGKRFGRLRLRLQAGPLWPIRGRLGVAHPFPERIDCLNSSASVSRVGTSAGTTRPRPRQTLLAGRTRNQCAPPVASRVSWHLASSSVTVMRTGGNASALRGDSEGERRCAASFICAVC
jgi:hypothetical protein